MKERYQGSAGFSFLDMVVSLTVSVIVLGAIFGLLTTGQVSGTVEMERADLQDQARHALELLSRDVLLAGTDLPPEFPSFRSSAAVLTGTSERIEILGNFRGDLSGSGPSPVESFDGYTARLAYASPFTPGDLVLFFDDKPTDGSWMVGLVREVRTDPRPEIDIVTHEGATVAGPSGSVTLPGGVDYYNRMLDDFPLSGYVTPVSVVSYEVARDTSDPTGERSVLLRSIDWGVSDEVAAVESMEIRYFVGGAFSGPAYEAHHRRPRIQNAGPPDKTGLVGVADTDVEVAFPPEPQPDPRREIDRVIRGVRISVTSRSSRGNLVGSSQLPSEAPDAVGYIRQTLTTRVHPRNIVNQATRRASAAAAAAEAANPDGPPARKSRR